MCVKSGEDHDDATGIFSGYAWSENAGWINFNCSNASSCGTVDFKVITGWVCDPLPSAPSGPPELKVEKSGSDALLSWGILSGATQYDIVRGNLGDLRSGGGDFSTAATTCLDDNRTTTSILSSGTPAAGDGFWFLVRGANCGGSGTYDSSGIGQVGLRDAEISASGNDCS